MREHQIIITLKPEQFLQVQRLARMAGAKSMGVFVRQKLLAALGIEGELEGDNRNIDLQPSISELKRLHSELRGFVAESLAMYMSESHAGEPVESDPHSMFSANNPLILTDSQESEDLEDLQELRPNPYFKSRSESDSAANDLVSNAVESYEEEYTPGEHTGEVAGSVETITDNELQEQESYSESSETQPEPVAAEESRTAPAIQPDDEFEKLADRTFAISPRLGAIEPAVQQIPAKVPPTVAPGLRDPLGDLLAGAEILEAEILEPELLAETISTETEQQVVEDSKPDSLKADKPSEPEHHEESHRKSDKPTVQLNELSSGQAAASTNQQTSSIRTESSKTDVPDSPKPAPDAGSLGNFGGSPISGGPPPKRRKS